MKIRSIKNQVKNLMETILIRPCQHRKICRYIINKLSVLHHIYLIIFNQKWKYTKSVAQLVGHDPGKHMDLNSRKTYTDRTSKMLGCFSLWLGKIQTNPTDGFKIFLVNLMQNLDLSNLSSNEFMSGNIYYLTVLLNSV